MKGLLVCFLFASLLSGLCSSALQRTLTPIVTLPSGLQLQGALFDAQVQSFLGIPFAQPPVGELRWAAPASPQPWSGVLQVTVFGNSCPQNPSPQLGRNYSEDCLYANVFAPSSANSSSKLPVLVWIYGGSYTSGSATDYPPMNIIKNADQDVLVVTFNYRLGVFGTFALPTLLEAGQGVNYGLMDQQFALQWVHDNIAAFGGDPNQVTLFGESAGAGSILLQFLLPSSWPYFHRVILESFGPVLFLPVELGAAVASTVASSLGCADPTTQLTCLRALDEAAVFAASLPLLPELYPVVDGQTVLQQPPRLLLEEKWRPDTPVLLGNNAYEGNLFAFGVNNNLTMNQQTYNYLLNKPGPLSNYSISYDQWYAPIAASQGYWTAYSKFFGDFIFYCGTVIVSEYMSSAGVDVYRYNFVHPTSIMPYPFSVLNATHFTEVPYVFQLGKGESFQFIFDESETELSTSILNYWINFALTGNPNGPNTPVKWPKFNPLNSEDPNQILVLDLNISTTSHSFDQELCELWQGVIYS